MNELNYRIDYGTSACATYAQVHVFGKKLFLTKISRFMENSSIKIFEYLFSGTFFLSTNRQFSNFGA